MKKKDHIIASLLRQLLAVTALLLFCLLVPAGPFAQNVSRDVVGAAGESGVGGANTFSYTIGEPMVETFLANTEMLTQGFQQPDKLTVTEIKGQTSDEFTAHVYPNPFDEIINVELEGKGAAKVKGQLVTLQGVTVNVPMEELRQANSAQFILHTENLSNGTYFLRLVPEKGQSSTFKIVKIR